MIFQIHQHGSLILGDLFHGNPSPPRYNVSNVLCRNRRFSFLSVRIVRTARVGIRHCSNFLLKLFDLRTHNSCMLEVMCVQILGLFLLQLGQLHLQLLHLCRWGTALGVSQPLARTCLIQQINCFVREKSVVDILRRQFHCSLHSIIGVLQPMMTFILVLQTRQDLDGLLHAGLWHHCRLKPTLQCGILLDVLAVLREGRGAEYLILPTGQAGLHDVGGVDGPFRSPGAHQRVHLVDDEDDVVLLLHLVQHLLQSLFELSTELGSSDQEG
mmetsp:Transcript_77294/g.128897  ORF Transcript_77294/g.128897 Transcript_77294/m.128897 type:complete len:270 (+) Transcript_77294:2729-3538(+)